MKPPRSTQTDPGFLAGEVLQQNYQLKSLIGEGGTAYVYLATHRILGGDVAVKVLQRRYAQRDDFRERFLREARLQYQLQHPNIVRVLDFIEERGLVGCVQEYCDGGELLGHDLAQDDALRMEQLRDNFFPLLDALGEVHDKGYIHRDIKPQNILVQRQREQQGKVLWKLNDFGLLKDPHAEQLTQSGMIIGTFHYISPEQFQESKEVDCRTDIYSLGVVLYQLLLGRVPFPSKMPRLAMQIMEAPVSFPPDFPAPLRSVLEQTLSKRPEERYPSCQALKEALQDAFAACHTAPSQPLPPSDTVTKAPTSHIVDEDQIESKRQPPSSAPIAPPPIATTPELPSAEAAIPKPQPSTQPKARASVPWGWLLALVAFMGLGAWLWRSNSPSSGEKSSTLFDHRYESATKQRNALLERTFIRQGAADFARQHNWGTTRYFLRIACKQNKHLCTEYALWVHHTYSLWKAGCRVGEKASCDALKRAKGRSIDALQTRLLRKARPVYKKACALGEAKACFILGTLSLKRQAKDNTWRPLPQQRQWLQRACRLKHSLSCLYLGHWHRHKRTTDAATQAQRWFRMACQQLDARGCLLWGQQLLQHPSASDALRRRAADAFGKACKLHSLLGCKLQRQQPKPLP